MLEEGGQSRSLSREQFVLERVARRFLISIRYSLKVVYLFEAPALIRMLVGSVMS